MAAIMPRLQSRQDEKPGVGGKTTEEPKWPTVPPWFLFWFPLFLFIYQDLIRIVVVEGTKGTDLNSPYGHSFKIDFENRITFTNLFLIQCPTLFFSTVPVPPVPGRANPNHFKGNQMEPSIHKTQPPTGTSAPKGGKIDPILAAGSVRALALKTEVGEAATFRYPEEFVREALIPWISKAKHHVTIEPGEQPGTTVVRKISAPEKRKPGQRGRSRSNESIEYRLMTLKPGETVNLGAANYFSVAAVASAIKARGQAAFHVTTNEAGDTLAKRSTGVFITKRDGTQREADPKTLRGEYPFRAMEDGDAYTIEAGDHKGIHAITLHCRRYQKLRGWAFTPTLHHDGTITIQCHVNGEKPGPIPVKASQD